VFARPLASARVLILAATAICVCGCSSQSNPPTGPSGPTVASVAVTGSAPTIGTSAQFSATATLSNNATQNVTAQATWSSSNPAVATVSASGLVAATAVGEVDIAATYQTVVGRIHVTIARAVALTFTITGTVTDGTSGGILPNINIQITDSAGNSKSTLTGATGTYSIAGFVAGPATLVASAVSYHTATVAMSISADARVDVVLQRTVCTFTLNATAFPFRASGGTGTITLASQATVCAWTAKSNDAFITISSGTSGNDTGTVTFAVALNIGPARVGTLTVAGQTVTVTQDAANLTVVQAVYDPALKAPACHDITSGCDSAMWLAGSGSTESNQPNTIANSCPDGSGSGHSAIVDSIVIHTTDGSALVAGRHFLVEASVRLTVAVARIRLYFANDAQNPVWSPASDFDVPAAWSGTRITLAGSDWPAGGAPLQAIRVSFSATNQFSSACATGTDDDNDDLVFRVQ
jgi:Carboxypeptidase regulatory-like domain/Bacterial Ig-like domain (group 2)